MKETKIQNPCSLYQNVKELRKKEKKIQNPQDCCRLRIEKRKPHNPLSHLLYPYILSKKPHPQPCITVGPAPQILLSLNFIF